MTTDSFATEKSLKEIKVKWKCLGDEDIYIGADADINRI